MNFKPQVVHFAISNVWGEGEGEEAEEERKKEKKKGKQEGREEKFGIIKLKCGFKIVSKFQGLMFSY